MSTIHDLEVVLIHLAASHYCVVSSACLYVYDFFLTLPQEVEYFWSTPWTFVKGIFFWNRYSTFALVGTLISYQALKIVLYALFILEMMSLVGIGIAKLVTNHETLEMVPFLSNPLTLCVSQVPRFFVFDPIPIMVFDTILLCLVMYKAYLIQTETLDKKWTSTRLMQIMFRDSVLYFACTFVANLLNTLVWAVAPLELFTMGTAWAATVPIMAANRVLFSMRSAYHDQPNISELNVESIKFQTARRRGGTSSGLNGWSNSTALITLPSPITAAGDSESVAPEIRKGA
ncbi:hypothetical protein FB45DRAFT_1032281 [Roridomyces roridus]|uniref:DUF6533 domain-containing protein n=1 Tax=Roridomyces roridus TaxID=1738132 RepID=A0AAD7BHC2_9AGAR|nr:hypothetical protein FB45DRAFT_1032281 [Roridomyces roridus]